MDSPIHGPSLLLLLHLLLLSPLAFSSKPQPTFPNPNPTQTQTQTQTQINSNSILVALLDSHHHTDLAELIEKALLLPTLESALSQNNLTIFAPLNSALDRHLHPDFKRFLLEPRNIQSLQTLLLSHFTTTSPTAPTTSPTTSLSGHPILLPPAALLRPNALVRPDGVIHSIDRLIVPTAVQDAFNRRRSLADISAVLPSGAPEVDPRTHRLKKPAPPVPAGAPPVLPIYDALAPGPNIAPAPAPGPGSGKRHFDGESQVKDFIQTLLLYGGYNELADILVNLTSLATEMGRLVSEGYVLTVLAPNDDAMARLTTDQLSEPGAPEAIVYYHLIPEYQTEESMYNAVRRFGKVRYDTLRVPDKVVAREADGSVKFGEGEGSAYLFDPDIYTDGRISVQGIDAVLWPASEKVEVATVSPAERKAEVKEAKEKKKKMKKSRRGKLMEIGCNLLEALGQSHRITSCQMTV